MYLLIQHGSYQLIEIKFQPLMSDGQVFVYRGIGKSKEYKQFNFDILSIGENQDPTFKNYLQLQAGTFFDSALSFNIAHEQIHRCETDFLKSENVWGDLARTFDLNCVKDAFFKKLRHSYRQSFTLDESIASWKFGPNYVKCKTSITNIRLTTFFAGENEVRMIDPRKLEIIDTIGCKRKSA
jgi:hypothetical protein